MLTAEIFSGVRAYFLLLPDDAMPEYAAGELAVTLFKRRFEQVFDRQGSNTAEQQLRPAIRHGGP